MERVLLLLLMLSSSSLASSLESISPGKNGFTNYDCFQASRCTNSSHLRTFPAEDEYECQQSCNTDARCKWFTYFSEQGLCQMVSNCRQLSSCPTCLGGSFSCTVTHMCRKGSQCQGELIDSLPVANIDECLANCKSIQGCKWLTYIMGPNQLCLLFRDCSVVDETCSRCITCEPGSRPMDSGYAALIFFGNVAEIYSPEGQCSHNLAKIPIKADNPVLVVSDNQIIACGGQESCWEYNPRNDSWRYLAQAPFEALHQPGVVLERKLYVIDSSNVHILDLMYNTWSSGPQPPMNFGRAPSTVVWRDSIILLGGLDNKKGVQIFNVTSQHWTIKSSENVPFEILWSSSLLISENEVLIVGSAIESFIHSAAIYNPETDYWKSLPASQVPHVGSRLVKLGSRVFALGGAEGNTIEEFFTTNTTWSLIGVNLIISYNGHHSIVAVPARLFAHLPGGCKGVL